MTEERKPDEEAALGQRNALPAGTIEAAPEVKRPAWIEPGEWSWISFTAGDYAEQTVLRVSTKRGNYQHLITLDWGDYGDRDDAESLARWIADRMNR